jgi:hypothetical protein
MPNRIVQETAWEATQDAPAPALLPRRKRIACVLRASWGILRRWQPARSHRPPEMHAIDHLAKHHTKVFV